MWASRSTSATLILRMIERYTYTPAARFNIAGGDQAPVRRADGELVLRWGMTPPWRGHGGKRGPLVYAARLDEVDRIPMLRDAAKKQRCSVLADGYYAWRGKQAWWFHGDGAFAGVWGERDDGVPGFAILHAGDIPAIVDADAWLAHAELRDIAWPGHAVSDRVKSHDDAACIAPLAQTSMF